MDEEGARWKRQHGWFHEVQKHALELMEDTGIIQARRAPPPRTRVSCLDEMGQFAQLLQTRRENRQPYADHIHSHAMMTLP